MEQERHGQTGYLRSTPAVPKRPDRLSPTGHTARRGGLQASRGTAISPLRQRFNPAALQTAAFSLLLCCALPLQAEVPPAADTTLHLEEVTVTGSRTERPVTQTPGNISVLSPTVLRNSPAHTIDDLLTQVSGVNTTRSTGMAQWHTNISVRGLSGNEQGRTLVLLDGIPQNSTGSGSVNWNTIQPDQIQRIEIFKGPGSSLYGNNAMGGVISIISKQALSPFGLSASVSCGSMSTQLYRLSLSSRLSGLLSVYLSGYYNRTAGYNPTPPELRTRPDYSINRYMREGGFYAKLTVSPSALFQMEIAYDLYRDKRSEGERIRHPDGRYREQPHHHLSGRLHGTSHNFSYQLALYFFRRNFYRVDERIRKGQYVRIDTRSLDRDWGGIASFSFTGKHNHFTAGGEYRQGSLNGRDQYTESPDRTANRGSMAFISLFAQDEISLFQNLFWLQWAVRYDHVRFYKGYYDTEGEHAAAFEEYSGPLESNRWENYSPRIALRFNPLPKLSLYLSFSQGFKAAMLDDLCRSGQIWIGPKIANPTLGPEKLDNYEIGGHARLGKYLAIDASFYYARGKDFLYYIRTGKQLWDGRDLYRRENISGIRMKGAEMELTYALPGRLRLHLNYTYNQSRIRHFRNQPEYNGKRLTYAPLQQVKGSLSWTTRFLELTLRGQYKTKQYTDEENKASLPAFSVWDVQVCRWLFHRRLRLSADVTNLFNTRSMNTRDTRSTGRLLNLRMALHISK